MRTRAKTVFEIARQSAQNISNVGGNQTINYGDRSRAARIGKVLAALGLVLFLVGLALLVPIGVATTQEVLEPFTRAKSSRPTPSTSTRVGLRRSGC